MNEITVALITAVVTAITTIGAQWLVNKSSVKVANIESYPDMAEQLSKAIDQNLAMNAKLTEATEKLSDATAQTKQSNKNLVKATAVIREMVDEVKRIGGDASVGIKYLKERKNNEQ